MCKADRIFYGHLLLPFPKTTVQYTKTHIIFYSFSKLKYMSSFYSALMKRKVKSFQPTLLGWTGLRLVHLCWFSCVQITICLSAGSYFGSMLLVYFFPISLFNYFFYEWRHILHFVDKFFYFRMFWNKFLLFQWLAVATCCFENSPLASLICSYYIDTFGCSFCYSLYQTLLFFSHTFFMKP